MNLKDLQQRNQPVAFGSGTEIMLAMTEELGEVAQEVALLEQVGTKKSWLKAPSTERLGEELTHLLNLLVGLADYYQIDLSARYEQET